MNVDYAIIYRYKDKGMAQRKMNEFLFDLL